MKNNPKLRATGKNMSETKQTVVEIIGDGLDQVGPGGTGWTAKHQRAADLANRAPALVEEVERLREAVETQARLKRVAEVNAKQGQEALRDLRKFLLTLHAPGRMEGQNLIAASRTIETALAGKGGE